MICDCVSFVLVQLELAELNLISFQAPYCKVQCMCFQLIQSRKDNCVLNKYYFKGWVGYLVLWYFSCGFELFLTNKCSSTKDFICYQSQKHHVYCIALTLKPQTRQHTNLITKKKNLFKACNAFYCVWRNCNNSMTKSGHLQISRVCPLLLQRVPRQDCG